MRCRPAVVAFTEATPSASASWRAIVLFGRNVASYKFALAGALLELANRHVEVRLDELALPYARRLCTHVRDHGKQGTFERSRFLDACRSFNAGVIGEDELCEATMRLGFDNVVDAFHVVDGTETKHRFFVDERRTGRKLALTDSLLGLAGDDVARVLAAEVEARWQLVERAWALGVPRRVLTVSVDPAGENLVTPRRRAPITDCRSALNGYQKGACFYCFDPITPMGGRPDTCHVDHVFSWSTGPAVAGAPIDGIWNLVLACGRCNGWHGKSNRPPHVRYVERLHRRNEFLVASHHPLRPTLVEQTGGTSRARRDTLRSALAEVTVGGARTGWLAPDEGPAAF